MTSEVAVAPESPVEETKIVHVKGELIATIAGAIGLTDSMSEEQRAEALRTAAKLCTEGEARLAFVQGEALFELLANGGWKNFRDETGLPYARFEDWVASELGTSAKTAYNRVNVYKAIVIKGGLAASDLVGVTNFSSIPPLAPYFTPENAKDLLDQVKALSQRDAVALGKHLKAQEEVDVGKAVAALTSEKAANAVAKLTAPTTGAEAPGAAAPGATSPDTADATEKPSTIKVTGTAPQINVIREAISLACTLNATQSDAAALEAIATEFLVSHAGESGELNQTEKMRMLAAGIAALEARFGCELEVKGLATGETV